MKNKKYYFIVGVIVIIVIIAFSSFFVGGVTQPIQFNHYLHTQEQQIDCLTCHTSVKTASWASLPGVKVCMMCHEEALTESLDEEKIREYAKSGLEIPWKRLFQVPDHVYFSHLRHVTFGEIECVSCHGDMPKRTSPPKMAPKKITMDGCMDCHLERQASIDCTACHR